MSSNGWQNLPRGGSNLYRHYFVSATSPASRRLPLQTSRRRPASVASRSLRAVRAGTRQLAEPNSSLLSPHVRRSDRHLRNSQLEAEFLGFFHGFTNTAPTLSKPRSRRADRIQQRREKDAEPVDQTVLAEEARLEDGEWEDIEIEEQTTRFRGARLFMTSEELRILQAKSTIFAQDPRTGRLRRLSPRQPEEFLLLQMQQESSHSQLDAPDQNVTIAKLARDQETMARTLNQVLQLLVQIQDQQRSWLSKSLHHVKRLGLALSRALSNFQRLMNKASERYKEDTRPTKQTNRARAIMLGALHVIPPQVTVPFFIMLSLTYLPATTLNVHEFLIPLVHTASLPMLIAMGPGMKKAYRGFRLGDLWKGLVKAKHARALSSSSTVQGGRKDSAYRDLVNTRPDVLDQPFPMAAVLNDLRNLQARYGPTNGREYKIAERRLYRVQHESETGNGQPLTVRQVSELLQPDDSVGWRRFAQGSSLTALQPLTAFLKQSARR